MGRKIPSKKHNKLKSVDPFNRAANSLKNASVDSESKNKAPKSLTQEAPGSLKRLFCLNEEEPKKNRSRKKKMKIITNNFRDESKSAIEQNEYETDEQFFKRVSRMASFARNEARISEKYDVKFSQGGGLEFDVPEDEGLPTRKKRRAKELKEKQLARKKKVRSNVKEETLFVKGEVVKFGEVVHAPPLITAKIRGAQQADPKRIAKNLLCNPSTVKQGSELDMKITQAEQSEDKFKKIGTKTKLKQLPSDKRSELEAERLRVIESYRKMRNKV